MLEKVWRKSRNVEKKFKHKAILFVPTESFDAPTITVMQGLEKLGWAVYVIGKPNVNSWFVNTVIGDLRKVKFDFVLSNLHWGNRWDHYERYDLHDCFKVLIDGCDNRKAKNWKEKFVKYRKRYAGHPTEEVMVKELQPHRWTMPLGGYEPDAVFTSQKPFGDGTFYLPFGIHRGWRRYAEGKICRERKIDFANVPGPGTGRQELTAFLSRRDVKLPGRLHSGKVKGPGVTELRDFVDRDGNVHSYHRWVSHPAYYRLLNDTKILIYPNVYADRPHWDSMRVWEGYASGCLCLLEKPSVDMAQYPATNLCEAARFSSHRELIERAGWLHRNQGRLEQFRLKAVEGALKYFTPVSLARYFLWKISRLL